MTPPRTTRIRHKLASLAHRVLDRVNERVLDRGSEPQSRQPATRPSPEQEAYVLALPIEDCVKRRVLMTIACADADPIPKDPRAGQVISEGGRELQVMHNGVRIQAGCYYGGWMTEVIRILRGHHEPQEEQAFHQVLRHVRPGSTMIELGSFWGYYSLWFLRRAAQGRCLLVEPDPNNRQVGEENFRLNGQRGEFFGASVGREGRPPEDFVCESDGVVRQVPQISVDDLAAEQGVDAVEVLLADVQGAELSALEGCRRLIAEGRLRFVVLSTHHHSISGDPLTHQKCRAFLQEHRATILAEHSIAESYSGDGLIVASLQAGDRGLGRIPLSRNEPAKSLFPETEYDLAEAWKTIAELEAARAPGPPR